jgi:hypothetical protein
MLKHGVDYSTADGEGNTPLIICCSTGRGGSDTEQAIRYDINYFDAIRSLNLTHKQCYRAFSAAGADFAGVWDILSSSEARFQMLLRLYAEKVIPDPPGGLRNWISTFIDDRNAVGYEISAKSPIWSIMDPDIPLDCCEKLLESGAWQNTRLVVRTPRSAPEKTTISSLTSLKCSQHVVVGTEQLRATGQSNSNWPGDAFGCCG